MPLPGALVVKNGSIACLSTSGLMPCPVSLTVSITYSPGRAFAMPPAALGSSDTRRISIVSMPPLGMASRALIARLRIALSTSPGLAEVWHGSGDKIKVTVTCSPSDRLSSSTVPVMQPLRSSRSSPTSRRLERRSSLRVRLAPIWIASIACWITLRIFSSALRSVTASKLEEMAASTLLKSCAMPPASWPIASVRCDCASAACASSRRAISRSRLERASMSAWFEFVRSTVARWSVSCRHMISGGPLSIGLPDPADTSANVRRS